MRLSERVLALAMVASVACRVPQSQIPTKSETSQPKAYKQQILPQSYQDLFSMLREDGDRIEKISFIKKMPDGSMRFDFGFASGSDSNYVLSVQAPDGVEKILISCYGGPIDRAVLKRDYNCFIDGGYFGEFDGRVDAKWSGRRDIAGEENIANLVEIANVPDIVNSIRKHLGGFFQLVDNSDEKANSQHQKTIKYIVDNPPDV